jgi:hypothetical protein
MDSLVNMNKNLRIGLFFSTSILFFIIFISTGQGIFIFLSMLSIGVLIYSNVIYARKTLNEMQSSLGAILGKINFTADDSYLSDDFLSGIALNKEINRLVIIQRKSVNDEFIPYFYDFDEILECSIMEDSETITSNGSVVSRAMVGGIIAGGIGATVGAVTANKISKEQIYRATLTISFDNLDYPFHEIHFLNSQMLMNRNSKRYQEIYNELNKWYRILSVIIKRNEKFNY